MLTIQMNNLHLKIILDELMELTDDQLRTVKLRYANARGGSLEHRIYIDVDRILRSREGTWMGRVL